MLDTSNPPQAVVVFYRVVKIEFVIVIKYVLYNTVIDGWGYFHFGIKYYLSKNYSFAKFFEKGIFTSALLDTTYIICGKFLGK